MGRSRGTTELIPGSLVAHAVGRGGGDLVGEGAREGETGMAALLVPGKCCDDELVPL